MVSFRDPKKQGGWPALTCLHSGKLGCSKGLTPSCLAQRNSWRKGWGRGTLVYKVPWSSTCSCQSRKECSKFELTGEHREVKDTGNEAFCPLKLPHMAACHCCLPPHMKTATPSPFPRNTLHWVVAKVSVTPSSWKPTESCLSLSQD